MTINREATIRLKGYDPDDLSHGSVKPIWANCDDCGKGRWTSKNAYCGLCKNCALRRRHKPPKPKFVDKSNKFIKETGIDRIKTIKEKNYDPADLKSNSNREVWCICLKCGKGRWLSMGDYRDLCYTCAMEDPKIRSDRAKACRQYYINNPDARKVAEAKRIQFYIDNPKARESVRLKSIEYWSDQVNRDAQAVRRIQFYIDHPEAREAARLKALENSEINAENMRGGFDLVWHHVAYDFNDPDALRVRIIRKFHSLIHHPKGCSFSERGYSLID